jgi:hypothetical protein
MSKTKERNKPWILVYDIETSPILGWVWSLWENNLSLQQIEKDWEILAFAAKWYQDPKTKIVYGPHNDVIYMDQRNNKTIINDKKMLKALWELVNESDVLLTQNGVSFDNKKIAAKFLEAGLTPPSPSRQIDTKTIMSSSFALTSNKLEYATEKFNVKFKKIKNSGFSLWTRCMKGELAAWDEMKKYNQYDILSLEELHGKLNPWNKNPINFNVYTSDDSAQICTCGSSRLQRRGFSYSNCAKYQRFQCQECGAWTRSKKNMLTKAKKELLKAKA